MKNYNYSKNNHCKCGKRILNTSERCRSCVQIELRKKDKTLGNYKDGRCFKQYYCVNNCGNEISYPNWLYGNQRCTRCAGINKRGKIDLNSKTNKEYFCKCGKKIDFSTVLYKSGKCRSCSMKEFYKFHPNAKKGKNSANWLGGISIIKYPSEFTEELKENIRKRDNYTCQNCGMTEEEHLIVVGKVLSVHHIDYNKQNCKEDNLITTCQQCNARANYNRDYWQDFYIKKINEISNKLES